MVVLLPIITAVITYYYLCHYVISVVTIYYYGSIITYITVIMGS